MQAGFTNQQVDIEQLPDLDNINFQQLSEKYAPTNFKIGLFVLLILALIIATIRLQPWLDLGAGQMPITLVSGSVWLFIVFTVIYNKLADPIKTYALREHDLSYSEGLIFKKIITQPISRIQHIELKRGPIERKIGLATLQVFSAGGAMHTFVIPGLALNDAEQLRQFILQHKDSEQHG
ncbi:MAG: PH domain-containing protein [Pseudomonadota bacterium]